MTCNRILAGDPGSSRPISIRPFQQGLHPNLLAGAVVNENDRYEELLGEPVPDLVPKPESFYKDVLSLDPVDARLGEIVPPGEQSDHLLPILVMIQNTQ